MEEKRLFLLDAYALIFRAYYALIKVPRLTKDGFNTSAIFGFVNTLEEVLRKEQPSHIAVCFDPPGGTFRSEHDEEYKANREATPEDIKLSVPVIKEILKAYRIPVVEVAGFEADDVIGTLARQAEEEGFTTYMMTPDKDFGQLVSPRILQYKPAYRGQDFEIRGEEEVCGKYGLQRTAQVIDLLALMGDKIDNIPGCPGVGEKTAVKLIEEFGSVENLLENTDKLKGALRKKVEENAELIRESKFLATIRTDVPVGVEISSLKRVSPDRNRLLELFKEYEFRTLGERVMRRIDGENKKGSESVKPAVGGKVFQGSLFDDFGDVPSAEVKEDEAVIEMREFPQAIDVSDAESLSEMQSAIAGAKRVGFYLLTEGENDMEAEWRSTVLAVAGEKGYKAYLIKSDFTEGKAAVLDLLARGDVEKVGYDVKRDYVVAARRRNDDAEAIINFYDLSLAHYLLQAERGHTPESLAEGYLGLTISSFPSKPKRGEVPMSDGERDAMTAKAMTERAVSALLMRDMLEKGVESEGMTKLLQDIEFPLVRVLAEMELTGVRIDIPALNEAAKSLEERLAELEKEIFVHAGESFNVGSPAQVGEILFGKLALDPKAKKTKTGQYSTGEEILEKIAHKHPIVSLILEWRQLKKLLTTYLTALPQTINKETGKVHTNYNQTVTATGRISSSSPNLQNIPVRDELGRDIRKAFIPDDGDLFLSADYSQIELRLVADFANDETMIEAFREGKDIHAITAAKVYGKTPETVSREERRHAKTANFGILYGISAFGLASRLGIPRADAKSLIDNYFATFPSIQKYMSDSVEFAREHEYVETRYGRRRRLPDINSKNPVVRGYAERNAINAPVQGSAADIIKIAMVRIAAEMRKRGLRSRMIMQVHDELNFNVKPDELPVLQEIVTREMEGAYSGRVRLTAESGVGNNWLEAH